MPYFGFKTMLGKLAWALLALAAIMTIVSAIITAVYIERCGDDVETLQKTNPNDPCINAIGTDGFEVSPPEGCEDRDDLHNCEIGMGWFWAMIACFLLSLLPCCLFCCIPKPKTEEKTYPAHKESPRSPRRSPSHHERPVAQVEVREAQPVVYGGKPVTGGEVIHKEPVREYHGNFPVGASPAVVHGTEPVVAGARAQVPIIGATTGHADPVVTSATHGAVPVGTRVQGTHDSNRDSRY